MKDLLEKICARFGQLTLSTPNEICHLAQLKQSALHCYLRALLPLFVPFAPLAQFATLALLINYDRHYDRH